MNIAKMKLFGAVICVAVAGCVAPPKKPKVVNPVRSPTDWEKGFDKVQDAERISQRFKSSLKPD